MIAIPTFRGYVYRGKTSEATTFLGEIRQRQEAYRAEFGQFASPSADLTTYTPTTVPGASRVAWPSGDGWRQLGASPDGPVYFQYASTGGIPGTDPSSAGGGSALGYDGSDFWFVSRAQADLDGDDQVEGHGGDRREDEHDGVGPGRAQHGPHVAHVHHARRRDHEDAGQRGCGDGYRSTIMLLRFSPNVCQISSVTNGMIGCSSSRICSNSARSKRRLRRASASSVLCKASLLISMYQSQNSCQVNW